jgi:hypothetical protein
LIARVFGFGLAVALLLAGCRGIAPTQPNNIVPAVMARNAPMPEALKSSHTTAWGTLVDDPSGRPLSNVPVRLYPWKQCYDSDHGKRVVCAKAVMQTHTSKDGRFILGDVPNGHYLLVIGTDSTQDLIHPTIHDNVWLKGGTQHLLAPVLLAVPTYTVTSVTPGPPVWRPEVERHGLYRLLTIRQAGRPDEEVPCIRYFDAARKAHGLAYVVIDEWLLENLRAFGRTPLSAQRKSGWMAARAWSYGLDPCHGMVSFDFISPTFRAITLSPQLTWFAFSSAKYHLPEVRPLQQVAFMEFPLDPRMGRYLGYPHWP